MANLIIRPSALPTTRPTPNPNEFTVVDNGSTVAKTTIQDLVFAGRPAATQSQAEVGTNTTRAMTPLTTKQSIAAQVGVTLASQAQGALAESAVQTIVAGANVNVDNSDPNNPILSAAVLSDGFATVAALLADTTMQYVAGSPTVVPGQIIGAQGFRYRVAASGAADNPLVTAGGVKLYALTGNIRAYGAVMDGVTSDSDAIDLALRFAPASNYARVPLRHVLFPEGGTVGISREIAYRPYTDLEILSPVFLLNNSVNNIFRNANALAFEYVNRIPEIAADTTVPNGAAVGTFWIIAGYRYQVVATPPANTITPYVNANGVWFVPDLDRHIYVRGGGFGVVIDGNGNNNNPLPVVDRRYRIGIPVVGMEYFSFSNFTVRNTAFYGFSMESGCRYGSVHDINFDQPASGDGSGLPNQDGIDIRTGCSDIVVYNIFGKTGDDCIAMNVLHPTEQVGYSYPGTQFNNKWSFGRETNVRRIKITQIFCKPIGKHNIVRLLTSADRVIEDVTIDGIFETTINSELNNTSLALQQINSCVLVGDGGYGGGLPANDSIRNVTIRNVTGIARSIIEFRWSSKDVMMQNITTGAVPVGSATFYTQQILNYNGPANSVAPGSICIHEGHYLNGLQYAPIPRLVGGVIPPTEAGRVIWHDGLNTGTGETTPIYIRNSVFANVDIAICTNFYHQNNSARLENVVFRDITVDSTMQHIFRVDATADFAASTAQIVNLIVPDRTKIWLDPGSPANLGRVYNARHYFGMRGVTPTVMAADTIPTTVPVGTELRFDGGLINGVGYPLLTRRDTGRWTPIRSDLGDTPLDRLATVAAGPNTYTITTGMGFTDRAQFFDGMTFRWRPTGANTGGVAFNVDGTGALAARKVGSVTAMVAGDITASVNGEEWFLTYRLSPENWTVGRIVY